MKKATRTPLMLLIMFCFFFLYGHTWTGNAFLYGQTNMPDSKLESLAKNFSYVLGSGPKLTLKDGLYEEGRSIQDYARIRLDSLTTDDLNGDGLKDIAVVLASNFGGSGHFYILTVLLNKADGLKQTNNLDLGDRVVIQSLTISQGKILMEILTHGPDDPMSSPSKRIKSRYRLDGEALREIK